MLQSEEKLEKEAEDTLQRALEYCDIDTPGPYQSIYAARAASIQHKLAALHDRAYRGIKSDDSKKKRRLQLCELHYDKAATLFLSLEHSSQYLTVQMGRVALAEHRACSTFFYQKIIILLVQIFFLSQ